MKKRLLFILAKLALGGVKPGFALLVVAGLGSVPARALPVLQLDILGGVYDTATKTMVADANPFTLRALINGDRVGMTRDFYLSAAIIPSPGEVPQDFGSFTVGGTSYSATSGMQWGTPPFDNLGANLRTHNVYPTWYAEIPFSAILNQTTGAYNVQDGTSGPGLLNYVDFEVDILGLYGQPSSPYAVHFDLYSYDDVPDGNGKKPKLKIDYFAPFSHDAASGHGITVYSPSPSPTNVPDGGTTAAMLGLGLLGVRFISRRKA